MSWGQSTIVLVFAILVVVVGGIWWLYTRHLGTKKKSLDPTYYLAALKGPYPEAFEVLFRFEQSSGLTALAEIGHDLDSAIGEIKKYAKSELSPPQKQSALKISPPSGSTGETAKVKAALVTIVRGIYSKPDAVQSLGRGGKDALDAFMSSLVE